MSKDAVRPLGPVNRHYWLALGMAKVTGADLARAMEEGRITQADWAEVVERCRGCGWTEGCQCWLDARMDGLEGEGAAVPRACPNAALFEKVLDGQ